MPTHVATNRVKMMVMPWSGGRLRENHNCSLSWQWLDRHSMPNCQKQSYIVFCFLSPVVFLPSIVGRARSLRGSVATSTGKDSITGWLDWLDWVAAAAASELAAFAVQRRMSAWPDTRGSQVVPRVATLLAAARTSGAGRSLRCPAGQPVGRSLGVVARRAQRLEVSQVALAAALGHSDHLPAPTREDSHGQTTGREPQQLWFCRTDHESTTT
jgi:hypothetical protein